MEGSLLIDASQSQLLLIDVQTRLTPAIEGSEHCINACGMLLTAARRLGLPVTVTEHCPDKVGPTIAILRDQLDPTEIVSKRHFNGALEPDLHDRLSSSDRPLIVIAGMEAHVCVLQTALGLKAKGFRPILVADAVGSRHQGVDIVNAEMAIFEWLGTADTKAFSDLLPMIKSGSVV